MAFCHILLGCYRVFAIMSRFFATGSDSESDSASEEEQVAKAPATAFTVSIEANFQHTFISESPPPYCTVIEINKYFFTVQR